MAWHLVHGKHSPHVGWIIHFGWELSQSSTRTGTKLVIDTEEQIWEHGLYYSVVLYVGSSFRALYTRLSFYPTENLSFFPSPSCHWNQTCLKEQLDNSSGSCGLEGVAGPLCMGFLMTHRLQWGCYDFMVTHYRHRSKPAWKISLSPVVLSFASAVWANCRPLCHILSRPQRLLSIPHRFFSSETTQQIEVYVPLNWG